MKHLAPSTLLNPLLISGNGQNILLPCCVIFLLPIAILNFADGFFRTTLGGMTHFGYSVCLKNPNESRFSTYLSMNVPCSALYLRFRECAGTWSCFVCNFSGLNGVASLNFKRSLITSINSGSTAS